MPFHKEWEQRLEEELSQQMFTVSKSSLEKFFSGCAYRAYLYRRWSLKAEFMPAPMKFGIAVHEVIEKSLEQGKPPVAIAWDPIPNMNVMTRAERALNWIEKQGYRILATEVQHIAPLAEDMQLFGIIDVIAETPEGESILIDWKTSSKLWTVTKLPGGELVYVGAKGWQGPVYLTPPYKSDILKEWPNRMKYVVIPEYETVEAYDYYKSADDDQALVAAARLMKHAHDTGNYPKNIGTYTCNSCDFKNVCWQIPGWEKYYTERRRGDEK